MPALNLALIVVVLVAVAAGIGTYRTSRTWGRVALAVVGVFAGFYAIAMIAHVLGFE